MRVVLFCYTREWGGTEKHTVELAEALARRGHGVTIVALGESLFDRERLARAQVFYVHQPIEKSIPELSFGESCDLFRMHRADVAILVKTHFEFGNVRFDLALREVFPRAICIEHSIPFPLIERQLASHLARFAQRLGLPCPWNFDRWRHFRRGLAFGRILTVSHANRRRLVREYGYTGSKVRVVHNGIDSKQFRPDLEARAEARRQWGISESAFVFGTLGRLCPVKGYDVAIAAFAAIRKSIDREIFLVLVGEGVSEGDLKQQALPLGSSVIFAGPTQSPNQSLNGFDCLLMPSRVEGLPFVLLESVATGVYPIATPIAGIPEVLRDSQLGKLVAIDDIRAWTEAMERRLGEKPILGGGREWIRTHFDRDQQNTQFARSIEHYRNDWRANLGWGLIKLLNFVVYRTSFGSRLRRYLEWE